MTEEYEQNKKNTPAEPGLNEPATAFRHETSSGQASGAPAIFHGSDRAATMDVTPNGGILLPVPPSSARPVGMGAKGHFSGTLVFGEGPGRAMEMESHTEMLVALVMLARRDVIDLENQVPFPWTDQHGVARTHYFDFRASLRDGSRVAIMVKSKEGPDGSKFEANKHRIAAQVGPDFAGRVCVMTEAHLDPVEVHNAELIHSVRLPDPEADAAARRAVAGICGAVRIGDLVDRLGLAGRGFRAIVHLLRCHELELATHERISHDARVRNAHVHRSAA